MEKNERSIATTDDTDKMDKGVNLGEMDQLFLRYKVSKLGQGEQNSGKSHIW